MTAKRLLSAESPWAEDAADRRKAATAVVINARIRANTVRGALPDLDKPIKDFCADLLAIEKAFDADPAAWRSVRPLTAVHLPSIVASLEALSQMIEASGRSPRIEAIEQDIKACLTASAQARAVLNARAATPLEIEAATLRAAIAPEVTSDEQNLHEGSGLTRRMTGLAGRHSKKLRQSVSNTITSGSQHIASFGGDAIARLDAGAGLAKTYVAGLVEDGIDVVTSPVSKRINALGEALSGASVSALVGGLVTAIVFPPAVPVAMGLALLEGTSRYGRALENADQTARNRQSERQQDRSRSQAARFARLKGSPSIVRMETPHIHVIMNVQTGQSKGIVLTGRFAGQDIADLDTKTLQLLAETAPDLETKEILIALRDRREHLSNEGAPDRPAEDANDLAWIFLGLG